MLAVHLGSSIVNFGPLNAHQLLKKMRGQLLPGDQILIGFDLVKDKQTLLSAYDDVTGITAAFKLNVLARLNRDLDADFQLSNFKHHAFWNAGEFRIEMHLESVCQQTVRIPTRGAVRSLTVHFTPGETIHREIVSSSPSLPALRCSAWPGFR